MGRGGLTFAPFLFWFCHTFVIHLVMDITATISQLEAKKAELEAQNEKNKAEIKDINLKIRRLDTVLKHAKNVLDEVGTDEPTSDAQG